MRHISNGIAMAVPSGKESGMIKLTWLPHWNAYAVRREGGRLIGLVRCKVPLPFRAVVEFV